MSFAQEWGKYLPFSPADVLLLVRRKGGVTIEDLCDVFGLIVSDTHYGSLTSILFDLERAGIVSFEGGGSYPIRGRITVTSKWLQVQAALNMSVVQLAELSRQGAMIVRPLFGAPRRAEPSPDLFVLMPFAGDLKPIYSDHILKVATSLGLSAQRADDLFTTEAVITDIWNRINMAKVIIADCTKRNPNVFYELGIAHTIGKPVVLLTQDNSDVPFDITHMRHIQYDYTPRGMRRFEEMLKSAIEGVLGL
jgi:hypothetical protein